VRSNEVLAYSGGRAERVETSVDVVVVDGVKAEELVIMRGGDDWVGQLYFNREAGQERGRDQAHEHLNRSGGQPRTAVRS
jgi:hypothetical protein